VRANRKDFVVNREDLAVIVSANVRLIAALLETVHNPNNFFDCYVPGAPGYLTNPLPRFLQIRHLTALFPEILLFEPTKFDTTHGIAHPALIAVRP
jgi:hypothetical protein